MRRFETALSAAIAFCCALSAYGDSTVLTDYKFGSTNPLATGKWVKISINGSGIYEITHERLREMGFPNPEKVAVYGLGGLKRNINFMTNTGKRIIEDEIKPVPVIHSNGKLLFYGLGDRNLTFCMSGTGSTKYPQFVRESLNTSSESTYYMLTDSHPAATPDEGPASIESAKEIETAYGYIYHEKDSVNGLSDSGDFWWGENISGYTPLKFSADAPYCTPDDRISFYSDIAVCHANTDGTINAVINGNTVSMSLNKSKTQVYQLYSHSTRNQLIVDSTTNKGHVELEFGTAGPYGTMDLDLGLDYWLIAYPSSFTYIDKDPAFSQFTAGFSNTTGTVWKHHAPAGSMVWDVTDPLQPTALNVEDGYFYNDRQGSGSMVTFNPAMPQKQINEDYAQVANQDLHKMQDTPYDMVIFTVNDMRKYAERIAELHKQYDGMNVAILTNEEIFNEFNAGTPEPTCYRLMTKMLYQHPSGRLKNVLFLGPIHGDYRNINNVPGRVEGMIAYQDNLSDLSTTSNVAMDYYGIMTDNLGNVTRIQDAPISLGVGVLPIDSDLEGELAVAKIRAYLEKEDFSGTVNSTYSIGCKGDDHIHEKQAIGFGNTVNSLAANNLGSKFAHETLWLESMEPLQAADRIQRAMRRGKALIYYYGHSVTRGFTGFNTYQSMNAGNKELGVMFFGGCDLTKLDKGIRGIGDAGVTRTKDGFIGILAATRTVMSNHNESLGNNFLNSMFFGRDGKWLKSTPTIGEVLSRAKENAANNSEVAYIYVGDPALRVPVALTPVKLGDISGAYRSGNVVTVKGNITDQDGNITLGYNGYVTVTVMEPPQWVVTPVPSDPKESKMPDYEINDLPLIAVKGKVTNGAFSVKVPLAGNVDAFLSGDDETVKLPVLVGTWDNIHKLGGSGYGEITMAKHDAEPDPEAETDTSAPVISLTYDNILGVVTADAHEDVAMLPGIGAGAGMTLLIDGTPVTTDRNHSADDAVTYFSGHADVASLNTGKHSAVLTATDIAGNTATKTLDFTITEGAGLTLSSEEKIAIGEIGFTLRGNDPDTTYRIVVTDNKGRVSAEQDVNGSAIVLDTTELPAGMYRAYVHHNSPFGKKANSNEVEFTVID